MNECIIKAPDSRVGRSCEPPPPPPSPCHHTAAASHTPQHAGGVACKEEGKLRESKNQSFLTFTVVYKTFFRTF
jgi:hypothetical protein